MSLRIILNGKKANQDDVRSAIQQLRKQDHVIEVRTTWEFADCVRLIKEAINEGVKRIVIGGGDGSLNEAVTALICLSENERPEMAIMPLGTANGP